MPGLLLVTAGTNIAFTSTNDTVTTQLGDGAAHKEEDKQGAKEQVVIPGIAQGSLGRDHGLKDSLFCWEGLEVKLMPVWLPGQC